MTKGPAFEVPLLCSALAAVRQRISAFESPCRASSTVARNFNVSVEDTSWRADPVSRRHGRYPQISVAVLSSVEADSLSKMKYTARFNPVLTAQSGPANPLEPTMYSDRRLSSKSRYTSKGSRSVRSCPTCQVASPSPRTHNGPNVRALFGPSAAADLHGSLVCEKAQRVVHRTRGSPPCPDP